ncbi:MAG: hypothetical protein R2867_39130 [Caldilineaceae bacterium]
MAHYSTAGDAAVGIVAIFEFTGSWNWFLGPLIYLSKMETFPLALALSYLNATYRVLWSEMMVVSFIAMLPPLLLFFIARRRISGDCRNRCKG